MKKAKTQIYDDERSGVYILENGQKKRFDSRRKAERYLEQTREGHGARRGLGMASGKQPKTGWMDVLRVEKKYEAPKGVYTKPKLREEIHATLLAQNTHGTKAGQWSGRKSQELNRRYKKRGGGFVNKK